MAKQKQKCKRSLNYDPTQSKGESKFSKSETVPDATDSIRDLLSMHTRGSLVLQPTKQPAYNGDNFVPDFSKMDAIDIDIYKQGLQNSIRETKQNLEDTVKALRIKKDEERRQQKIAESKRLDRAIKQAQSS